MVNTTQDLLAILCSGTNISSTDETGKGLRRWLNETSGFACNNSQYNVLTPKAKDLIQVTDSINACEGRYYYLPWCKSLCEIVKSDWKKDMGLVGTHAMICWPSSARTSGDHQDSCVIYGITRIILQGRPDRGMISIHCCEWQERNTWVRFQEGLGLPTRWSIIVSRDHE